MTRASMTGRNALMLRRCRGGYEARERRENRAHKRRVAKAEKKWSRMQAAMFNAKIEAGRQAYELRPRGLNRVPSWLIAAILLGTSVGLIALMWWVW